MHACGFEGELLWILGLHLVNNFGDIGGNGGLLLVGATF